MGDRGGKRLSRKSPTRHGRLRAVQVSMGTSFKRALSKYKLQKGKTKEKNEKKSESVYKNCENYVNINNLNTVDIDNLTE